MKHPETIKHSLLQTLLTLVIILVLLAGGLVLALRSGIYNIAATRPHTQAMLWAIDTLKVSSVRRHARQIEPPRMTDRTMILSGAAHYAQMCVVCHGAPGTTAGVIAKGLYPSPPTLPTVVRQWRPRELFWVVKHGLKLTGMPAFGPTHADAELWPIVAFLIQLPDISADEYSEMLVEAKGLLPESHDHAPHEHAH
jgi:mono/diheme cytochrome c family protein